MFSRSQAKIRTSESILRILFEERTSGSSEKGVVASVGDTSANGTNDGKPDVILEVGHFDEQNDRSSDEDEEGSEKEDSATSEAIESATNQNGGDSVDTTKASHHVTDAFRIHNQLGKVCSEVSLRQTRVNDGEDHQKESGLSKHFEDSNEPLDNRRLFSGRRRTRRGLAQDKERYNRNCCN